MAYLKPAAIETKVFNRLTMMSTLWDVLPHGTQHPTFRLTPG